MQMYDINDASIIAADASICQIFEMVGSLLADGRSYLVGDRFTDDLKAHIHRTFDLVKITFSYLDSATPIKVPLSINLNQQHLLRDKNLVVFFPKFCHHAQGNSLGDFDPIYPSGQDPTSISSPFSCGVESFGIETLIVISTLDANRG